MLQQSATTTKKEAENSCCWTEYQQYASASNTRAEAAEDSMIHCPLQRVNICENLLNSTCCQHRDQGGCPQLRQDWSEAQKLGLLTNEILKKQIFPNLHNWPELVVTSLEDIGVERKAPVTMVMEWLIGQGSGEPGHNCRMS